MNWKYSEDKKHIILDEPTKRNKKITGHRFPTILGIDQWTTPFMAWCEMTGLAKLPFETNKYVEFGKINECKQIDFARQKFPNVMSSEEYYGASWKDYQYSNYKDLQTHFDGVRDFVCTSNDGKKILLVGECKGSSHPEQWENGNVPAPYFAQAALYTYLDKLDKMLFVASFPTQLEYGHPETFQATKENTIMTVKRLQDFAVELPNGQYGGIQDCIDYCNNWWDTYITSGISPEFDEVKDKQYLDLIRTSKPINDSSLEELCDSAKILADEIKSLKETSGLNAKEKQLKTLESNIKEGLMNLMGDNDTKASCKQYKISGTISKKFNDKRFKEENEKLYESYCEESITYRLSKIKGDEDDDSNA